MVWKMWFFLNPRKNENIIEHMPSGYTEEIEKINSDVHTYNGEVVNKKRIDVFGYNTK